MDIKKIIKYIAIIINSIIFADYSTYFIESYKLSNFDRIMLFLLYFILWTIVFCYLIARKHLIGKIIRVKYLSIVTIVITIFIVQVFNSVFIIPTAEKITLSITALGEKNEKSLGDEVWITNIKKGSENMDLSKLKFDRNWIINNGALVSASNQESTLNIDLYRDKDIILEFGKHNYSGKVKITCENDNEIVDLYDLNGDTYKYKVSSNSKVENYYLRLIESVYCMSYIFFIGVMCCVKKIRNINIFSNR